MLGIFQLRKHVHKLGQHRGQRTTLTNETKLFNCPTEEGFFLGCVMDDKWQWLGHCTEERLMRRKAANLGSNDAFNIYLGRTVRQFEHRDNATDGTNRVEIQLGDIVTHVFLSDK